MKPTVTIPLLGYAVAIAWAAVFWTGVAVLISSCTQSTGNVQRHRVWLWQTNFHQ